VRAPRSAIPEGAGVRGRHGGSGRGAVLRHGAAFGVVLWSLWAASVALAAGGQSRTFVVSFFAQQFTNYPGDCPGGVNPEDERGQIAFALRAMGYSGAEVRRLMVGWDQGGEGERKVNEILERRAVINGEPVNPMTHPEAVPDPQLKFVNAKQSVGFDLDGKQSADDFVDMITGKPGIDNQLFRSLGCNQNFRGSWTSPSAYGEWVWVQLRDSQPAWLMMITDAPSGKAGEVIVRIQRSFDHLRSNMDGSPRWHATYRADPDPRSFNEYRGYLRDGELTIPRQPRFSVLWNGLSAPVLNLSQFQLRLQQDSRGQWDGLIGGFQPWRELYFAFSHNGIVGDRPGLWHAMKKAADADPEPATGQNLAISVAYRFTAIPAFITPSGASVRTAMREGSKP